jgi:hypothetical protein
MAGAGADGNCFIIGAGSGGAGIDGADGPDDGAGATDCGAGAADSRRRT